MKALFNLAFPASLALGEVAVWVAFSNQSLWFRLALSVAVPVLLLACILVADFVLVFLGLEGGSGLAGAGQKEVIRNIAGCGLFAGVTVVGAPLASNLLATKPHVPSLAGGIAETRASLLKSLDDWSGRLEKISLTASKFEEDRKSLASRIRGMGFASANDIDKTPAHRKVAEEFAELQSQIQTLRKREAGYKAAIEDVRSSLRRLERQEALESAGISPEELERMAQTVAETNERLEAGAKTGEKSQTQVELWLREALDPSVH